MEGANSLNNFFGITVGIGFRGHDFDGEARTISNIMKIVIGRKQSRKSYSPRAAEKR